MPPKNKLRKDDFENAGKEKQETLFREFVRFVIENKKWWMIPILIVLLGLGLLSMLSSTGAAPFIYSIF